MFAIPGILLLLGFVYARPAELADILRVLPLWYLICGLALFGWLIDLRLRKSRPAFAPADGAVAAFCVWALMTGAIGRPAELRWQMGDVLVPVTSYFLLSHAIQRFRAFQLVATTVLMLALYLAAVGVYQGAAPFGCHVVDPQSQANGDAVTSYDGRRCDSIEDCQGPDIDPNAEYVCEKIGLFGTSSVAGGRARYRGPLADPNELGLWVALGLPLALGLFLRGPGFWRGLLLAVALALIGACVVYTQSRAGLYVSVAVGATWCVCRFGAKGLLAAGVLAPAIVFGAERLVDWRGGGAHGAYAAVAAELRFPGLVAWASVLYLSAKILLLALRRYGNDASTQVARTWALALLTALVGLAVGLFFRPAGYDQLFWIVTGLCGAFYGACRTHDPSFAVPYGWRDFINVVAGCTLFALATFFYAGWQSR
jgi:hypothetical protein